MTTQLIVKLAAGNPGALDFLCKLNNRLDTAEESTVVKHLLDYKITGSRLYILYNDCCSRDIDLTIKSILTLTEDELDKLITGDGLHGYPVQPEKL